LNLQPLDEIHGMSVVGCMLRIGARTTCTEMIRSPLLNERVPALAAPSREVGGVQIQNRGTLAGNVANASPAGDTLPVLAVTEATVVLASADGERRVPFLDFYTGYRDTVMRPDELITAIEILEVEGSSGSGRWEPARPRPSPRW
jgi:xanthine dehydrogenase small subunit